MIRSVLAIRHVAFEGLGQLGTVLAERGCAVTWADAGVDDLAALDPLAPDLLVVLGGPIGVYQGDLYPFLADEQALLQARLAAGRPTLGICLGAQLMAAALGARVYPSGGKEIGWAPVSLTPAGHDSVLAPLGAGLPVLHWHGDTFDLPPGAERLASTTLCPNQAFSLGPTALALQFHLEVVVPAEVERWLIGHTCQLAALGPVVTVPGLRAATRAHGPALAPHAATIFRRWLDGLPGCR